MLYNAVLYVLIIMNSKYSSCTVLSFYFQCLFHTDRKMTALMAAAPRVNLRIIELPARRENLPSLT